MNDRELHCRSKASEARTKARLAITAEGERRFRADAKAWDREAEAAANDYSAGNSLDGGVANQAP